MRSNRPSASEASELVDAFFTFMPTVVRHMNEQLAPMDMTNTDLWALRTIDGPMPMKELAQRMAFDPSYVTLVADRLVVLDLIERQPHPTDRRVKKLVLTTKGKKLQKTIPEKVWNGPNVFEKLSAPEREQLRELLGKLSATDVD